ERLLDNFFFQAEDGIRDKLVTGVQTCALPISAEHGRGLDDLLDGMIAALPAQITSDVAEEFEQRKARSSRSTRRLERAATDERRSEERRVGKESSSRGWTDELETQ